MKDATTLEMYIDSLARDKVDARIKLIVKDLKDLVGKHYWAGPGQNGPDLLTIITNIMSQYVLDKNRSNNFTPKDLDTTKISDYFKGKILEEVLEKLPLVKELVEYQREQE